MFFVAITLLSSLFFLFYCICRQQKWSWDILFWLEHLLSLQGPLLSWAEILTSLCFLFLPVCRQLVSASTSCATLRVRALPTCWASFMMRRPRGA